MFHRLLILLLFVFKFSFFLYVQLGFFLLFLVAFIFLAVTTHGGFSFLVRNFSLKGFSNRRERLNDSVC